MKMYRILKSFSDGNDMPMAYKIISEAELREQYPVAIEELERVKRFNSEYVIYKHCIQGLGKRSFAISARYDGDWLDEEVLYKYHPRTT